jgi:hypothetical protein
MDWVKANATRVDELYHQHAASLDRFFGSLDVVPPDKDVLPGPVLDWLYKRFRAGARLALVDPITAISGDKPWVTDKEFLQPARRLCEDYGASLVLATHPARGGKQMAGSEAMRRFVDSVVWLIQHRPPKVESVRTRYGSTLSQRFNRTVRVTKSRFAAGPPGDLAYDFDGAGLRFAELGLIVEDDGSGNDAAPLPVEPEPDLTSSDVPPEPFVVPAPQPETEEPL